MVILASAGATAGADSSSPLLDMHTYQVPLDAKTKAGLDGAAAILELRNVILPASTSGLRVYLKPSSGNLYYIGSVAKGQRDLSKPATSESYALDFTDALEQMKKNPNFKDNDKLVIAVEPIPARGAATAGRVKIGRIDVRAE
jgi:hypothetical protein